MADRIENQPPSRPAGQPPMAGETYRTTSSPGMANPSTAPISQPGSGESGHSAVDQAKEKGQQAMDRAKETGQQAARTAEEKANVGIDKAADATQGLANTLRGKADTMPNEKMTDIAYQTAEKLEQGAEYLRGADASAMRGDLEDLIRRYPTQTLVVGAALGFLLARAFR